MSVQKEGIVFRWTYSQPLFACLCLFNKFDSWSNLPRAGFEMQISSVRSNCSTNCVAIIALENNCYKMCQILASLCFIFVIFTLQFKEKKHWCCAWDSNPGRRMEGEDRSTGLWRPSRLVCTSFMLTISCGTMECERQPAVHQGIALLLWQCIDLQAQWCKK